MGRREDLAARLQQLEGGQVTSRTDQLQQQLTKLEPLKPPVQKETGFMQGVSDFFTGDDRETRATRELPELGQGGLLSGEDIGRVAALAPVLLTTTNPAEIGKILSDNFDNVRIQEDEKGNLIAANNATGQRVVINQPGVSQLDILQGLGITSAFFPSAKLAGAGGTVLKKAALGAAGAGATEAVIQGGQAAAGGDFDPEDVAIAATLGGAAEAVLPAIKGAREAFRTKGTGDKVLDKALEKGQVLTTDIAQPKTFVGKSAQKISERVPVLGTGGVRKTQQASRVQALDDVAREFNIDPNVSFEKKIIDSANKVFRGSQKRAGELRKQAVDELNKVGDVIPTQALKTIDSEIKKIGEAGVRGDIALLGTLQDIKKELFGNFERVKNQRTTIFNDISDIGVNKNAIKSGGDSVLTSVARSLSKDLDEFAVNAGKRAGENRDLAKAAGKWKASNRIFKDNFAKAKDTELKKALTKGNIQPEVINTTIRGGKQSDLNRLFANLDIEGRQSVRQLIIKNALEKADGNPTKFLNELNRVNTKRASDVFFRGKPKLEIDGVKRFLDITRRAQDAAASIASQSEVSALGLIGGTALAPAPVIGAASTIGLLGRAYESKAVRNLLLKLSQTPKGSSQASKIAEQIKSLVSATAQAQKPQGE